MNETIDVITVKQIEELDRMLLTNPVMKKKVHKILSSVIAKARTSVSKDAKSVLNEDPRQAYRAVKRTLYKRLLGGSISILNKRRASNTRVRLERTKTSTPGQRGGNRMKRSEKTDRIDSYFGSDRGFILRFVNLGTGIRITKRNGNRGKIEARNWFGQSSQKAMEAAAQQFCDLIDSEIKNVLDK